jgi:isopenicillin-N epimerase
MTHPSILPTATPGPASAEFLLDTGVCFLNHGSFGATLRAAAAAQSELRAILEREPVHFMLRELPWRLERAREALGGLVGASAKNLAFTHNATTGLAGLLGSMPLSAGHDVLMTDHTYGACVNAVHAVAERAGARVVVAKVPFPLPDEAFHATDDRVAEDWLVETILAAVTPNTHWAVLDHVTSPTAIRLPVERLVPALRERGIETLVDGAHGPGMVALSLDDLGAWAYVGNLHKWVCAPKGAAFIHVRPDVHALVRPAVLSHGALVSSPARFHAEHDWTGTSDPTPWLVLPDTLLALARLHSAGIAGLMAENRAKAVLGRRRLLDALRIHAPCPASWLGAMATVALPDTVAAASMRGTDPLQDELWVHHRIEVPVIPWPFPEYGGRAGAVATGRTPRRWVRISMHAYNRLDQVDFLAAALLAAHAIAPK